MPLKGVPKSITPELLYALARMGHGDMLVIADANFPSDSVASHTINKIPIRVSGKTTTILSDILHLFPIDSYERHAVLVMDRTPADKERGLHIPCYDEFAAIGKAACPEIEHSVGFLERFSFYEKAKQAFVVVQTDDYSLYANAIISKGVIS